MWLGTSTLYILAHAFGQGPGVADEDGRVNAILRQGVEIRAVRQVLGKLVQRRPRFAEVDAKRTWQARELLIPGLGVGVRIAKQVGEYPFVTMAAPKTVLGPAG